MEMVCRLKVAEVRGEGRNGRSLVEASRLHGRVALFIRFTAFHRTAVVRRTARHGHDADTKRVATVT